METSSAKLDIGIVTDEISVDLGEALDYCSQWGVRRIELREGCERRFPEFTQEEVALVDSAIDSGMLVTAVSPGIFKGNAGDSVATRREVREVLPRAIDHAVRFNCPRLIAFGFDKTGGVATGDRLAVQAAFEAAAEAAAASGLTLMIENEPNFWIDETEPAVALILEIGHPSLKLNWDPANLVWGGREVTRNDFDTIRDLIDNVHVKDYAPVDPTAPWRPVGQGVIRWDEIIDWVREIEILEHVTLETHCADRVESSRDSLAALREIINVAAGLGGGGSSK